MSNDFLPKDYTVPSKGDGASHYMKFQAGDNRFRVLASPLMGYEWWVDKNGEIRAKGANPQQGDKPIRVKMGEKIPVGAAESVKHFWVMPVWNYGAEAVQILSITQATIQNPIMSYARDEDWGSPVNYDLVVRREGEGLETTYSVIAKPAKELDKSIKSEYESMDIDMSLFFEGQHPILTDETRQINKEKAEDIVTDAEDLADDIPF